MTLYAHRRCSECGRQLDHGQPCPECFRLRSLHTFVANPDDAGAKQPLCVRCGRRKEAHT